ncbi:plastid terminal oxidase [Cyanidioschyzon merolae strain 10D]|uniref:Plastid terminal oxidase n=1 Tax=Cyanidioschyzon merolae (strain NIES-3377 / 10D) TaxID=280699 RepID=M1UR83_CYAM1|nr:plastid terminal oxidase [Cyanidioschyzon merolae strain 10D]BAM80111.1 plastid terminal oxidase [Cyanidioschyzon merolae strain 10D]|eukprot:XP_005536397.1 plastid terminal oxidase [Cyanidioschyzon merolae strain 10D]
METGPTHMGRGRARCAPGNGGAHAVLFVPARHLLREERKAPTSPRVACSRYRDRKLLQIRSLRMEQSSQRLPKGRLENFFVLLGKQCVREIRGTVEAVAAATTRQAKTPSASQARLAELAISDELIAKRESLRESATHYLKAAPWLSRMTYTLLCRLIEMLFRDRPIERFWFLEMVARVPYFSFLSVLHLYESLDLAHLTELRRAHFIEEWNEMHHLLIMQALGGDGRWLDRFLAYHVSLVYYWALVLLYMIAPAVAYNFSELLEKHAYDTYAVFIEQNETLLRTLPAPSVARAYYESGERFRFRADTINAETHACEGPPVATLFDAFVNIRDDEGEHIKMMEFCQTEIISTGQASATGDQADLCGSRAAEAPALAGLLATFSTCIRSSEDRDRWNRWQASAEEWKRKHSRTPVPFLKPSGAASAQLTRNWKVHANEGYAPIPEATDRGGHALENGHVGPGASSPTA